MMSVSRTLFLFAGLLLATSTLAEDACARAYRNCDFRFRGLTGHVPTFRLSSPDAPFTPRIFSTDSSERIGVLNSNNIIVEAFVRGRAVPVTKFGDQSFSPSVVKPVRLTGTSGSALAHEMLQGNQMRLARGACVRVFFKQYQLLFPTGRRVSSNRNNVGRRENKCVVFRVARN